MRHGVVGVLISSLFVMTMHISLGSISIDPVNEFPLLSDHELIRRIKASRDMSAEARTELASQVLYRLKLVRTTNEPGPSFAKSLIDSEAAVDFAHMITDAKPLEGLGGILKDVMEELMVHECTQVEQTENGSSKVISFDFIKTLVLATHGVSMLLPLLKTYAMQCDNHHWTKYRNSFCFTADAVQKTVEYTPGSPDVFFAYDYHLLSDSINIARRNHLIDYIRYLESFDAQSIHGENHYVLKLYDLYPRLVSILKLSTDLVEFVVATLRGDAGAMSDIENDLDLSNRVFAMEPAFIALLSTTRLRILSDAHKHCMIMQEWLPLISVYEGASDENLVGRSPEWRQLESAIAFWRSDANPRAQCSRIWKPLSSDMTDTEVVEKIKDSSHIMSDLAKIQLGDEVLSRLKLVRTTNEPGPSFAKHLIDSEAAVDFAHMLTDAKPIDGLWEILKDVIVELMIHECTQVEQTEDGYSKVISFKFIQTLVLATQGVSMLLPLLKTYAMQCDNHHWTKYRNSFCFTADAVQKTVEYTPGSPDVFFAHDYHLLSDPINIARRNHLIDYIRYLESFDAQSIHGDNHYVVKMYDLYPRLVSILAEATDFVDVFAATVHGDAGAALGDIENYGDLANRAFALEPAFIALLSKTRLELLYKTNEYCAVILKWLPLISFYEAASEEYLQWRNPAWRHLSSGIAFWISPANPRSRCAPVWDSADFNFARLRPLLLPQSDYHDRETYSQTLQVDGSNVLASSLEGSRTRLMPDHPLRVKFLGQEGIDVGGLLREWYSLIIQELFKEETGLFLLVSGTQNTYIVHEYDPNGEHLPPADNHDEIMEFAGKVLGRAVIDSQTLGVAFRDAVYKLLLGRPVVLDDMRSEDSIWYGSLRSMLDSPDCSEGDLDVLKDITDDILSKKGLTVIAEKNILSADMGCQQLKVDRIDAYVQARLVTSIAREIGPFIRGFHSMIPQHALDKIISVKVLRDIIRGSMTIDVEDMISHIEAHLTGGPGRYSNESPQIVQLFNELRKYTQEELRRFVWFVTGTDQVPSGGFGNLKKTDGSSAHIDILKVDRLDSNGAVALPLSHTCFFQFQLPEYTPEDDLPGKLRLALTETSGFGMS